MKKAFWTIALMAIYFIPAKLTAQTEWTESEANKWFSKKEWLQGLKLTPHSSIDKKEFAVDLRRKFFKFIRPAQSRCRLCDML